MVNLALCMWVGCCCLPQSYLETSSIEDGDHYTDGSESDATFDR